MFLVVLEGALRKWVLPGLQAQIYFAKDIILIIAYILFLFSRSSPGAHLRVLGPFKILLGLTLAYFTLLLVNPESPSLLVSVLGFKNYFLYVPLIFVVPYMFVSAEDLERKLRIYVILMVPFVALGLVQFALPPTHWINGYLSHDDTENLKMGATFGSGITSSVRSIGTFSYIGGYSAFLTVMFYLGVGLIAKSRWRISGNLWLFAFLVITVAAMFTTGSRGPIWGLIATWPLVLCIWGFAGLLSMSNAGKTILAAALLWALAQLVAGDAFEAYSYRAEVAGDTMERVLAPLIQVYWAMQVSGPIGIGMGSTSAGALTIMRTTEFWWLTNSFEVETARVLHETGILGFILVYAARVWLLVKAIGLSVHFKNPLYIGLSGVIAGLFMQDLIGFVVNNATLGIYHWFAAGLLFAMYRLEAAEAARKQEWSQRAYGRVAGYRRMNA